MTMETYTPQRCAKAIARFQRCYDAATPSQLRQGVEWYPKALHACERIASRSGRELPHVIACVAALSPRKRWRENLRLARRMCMRKSYANPGHFAFVARKAWDCLNGGAFTPLKGPKTSSFALNIAGDVNAVTIDTHMLGVALHGRKSCSPRQYDRLASCVRRVDASHPPRDVQAIIWHVTKRID